MSTFKNNRWLSIATLILLIANIVTLTLLWIQNKNKNAGIKPPAAQGQVFEFLTKELQLDEQQQKEYRSLRDEHQVNQKQIQDSIRKAKDAFFSLLQQPNLPDSLLQEYSKKASALDQQMDIITFRHFQKLRGLCNASQQKKFDDLIKEVMQKMAGPRGHPPPGSKDRPPRPGQEEVMPPTPL